MSEAAVENEVTDTNADASLNPFGPQEAPGIALIVQMRIYDVLMALLTVEDPEKAQALLELHAQGVLMGNSPTFANRFVADNLEDD